MKTRRLLSLISLAFAALSAAVISPVAAAEITTTTRPVSDRFKVSYSILDTPEMDIVADQLKAARQRYEVGKAEKDVITAIEAQLDRMMRDRTRLLTIHSDGGTLRELLTVLAAGKETSLSVINAGDQADLDLLLPAFDLRRAPWTTVVEVMANFVATRGLLLKIAGSDQPNPNSSNSVICVMRRADGASAHATADSSFEAVQLSDYLSREQTVETITEAIRAGWSLVPDAAQDALRLKYHPETKLLLISGPAPAVQVAKQVIGQLKKKPANP